MDQTDSTPTAGPQSTNHQQSELPGTTAPVGANLLRPATPADYEAIPKKQIMPHQLEQVAHRFANAYPIHAGADGVALAEDIKKFGLRIPIILYQGQILDGRRRLVGCLKESVEPRFEVFEGTEEQALALVVSLNSHRRDMTKKEKEATALKLMAFHEELAAKRKKAGVAADPTEAGRAADRAAAAARAAGVDISSRTLQRRKAEEKAAAAAAEAEKPKPLITTGPDKKIVIVTETPEQAKDRVAKEKGAARDLIVAEVIGVQERPNYIWAQLEEGEGHWDGKALSMWMVSARWSPLGNTVLIERRDLRSDHRPIFKASRPAPKSFTLDANDLKRIVELMEKTPAPMTPAPRPEAA